MEYPPPGIQPVEINNYRFDTQDNPFFDTCLSIVPDYLVDIVVSSILFQDRSAGSCHQYKPVIFLE